MNPHRASSRIFIKGGGGANVTLANVRGGGGLWWYFGSYMKHKYLEVS